MNHRPNAPNSAAAIHRSRRFGSRNQLASCSNCGLSTTSIVARTFGNACRVSELGWKRREVLDAGGRDAIHVFDANPTSEVVAVSARLRRENFSVDEHVVPLRVQVRVFMRLEPNA